MTEKELKKLNRYQLLELLVMQTERADNLQKQVDELEKRLEEREINMSKISSVAEASLYISGVFEASQKAADLYLHTVMKKADDYLTEARSQADAIVRQARERTLCISDVQQENFHITSGKRKANVKEQ